MNNTGSKVWLATRMLLRSVADTQASDCCRYSLKMFIALNYGNHSRLSASDYSFIYAICAVALALSAGHVVLSIFDLLNPNNFPLYALAIYHRGLHARERARVRHLPAREGAQEAELVAHHSRVPRAQGPLLQRARLGAHSSLRAAHATLQRAAERAQCAAALVRVQRRALPSARSRFRRARRRDGRRRSGSRRSRVLLSADFYMLHEALAPIAFFFSSRHFRKAWTATLTPCSLNHTRRPTMSHIHEQY